MHRIMSSLLAIAAAALVTAGFVSTAMASHPSIEQWTVELQSVSGPGCITVTKVDSQEGVFEIDNMCNETMTIDSVTCSPDLCEFETVQIQDGTSKKIGPKTFGLSSSGLQEGESVDIEFNPKIDGSKQPTMAFKLTFDGMSDASHAGDTGSGGSEDAGDEESDTGGGDSDVALSSDAGSEADGGGSGGNGDEASDDGGCSTVGSTPVSPAIAWMLVATLLAVRTRNR